MIASVAFYCLRDLPPVCRNDLFFLWRLPWLWCSIAIVVCVITNFKSKSANSYLAMYKTSLLARPSRTPMARSATLRGYIHLFHKQMASSRRSLFYNLFITSKCMGQWLPSPTTKWALNRAFQRPMHIPKSFQMQETF